MAEIHPIGTILTPFDEKFGIPRQASLLSQVQSQIIIHSDYKDINAFRGLVDYSHIWLIFGFHQVQQTDFKPLIRPPRLGGNQKLGVFASRSPFRPNQLGMSVVQLHSVKHDQNSITLNISGADVVNETPLYDIKPYIPYADSIADAVAGVAPDAPEPLRVMVECHSKALQIGITAQQLEQVTLILQSDPRPAYQNQPDRTYKVRLFGCDWHFLIVNNICYVRDVQRD
ncbi:tRNA (N6-threonylcarbamoyladenosine(37)-N6)-methyltransferase TrmO [Alteromonas sp. LMIT006]|jgi:tRNA-Thr(GGU) m(6)t(6)A37 methyltransferase TsaA|uniref:tRNA (N6-threonylcarbamoyladenosine(37)-N6)-methyltransferase TrmO n=1 Tax=Alteromonadaceae TaxID=72275 RepID=UPI0020CA45FD|nr:tRNA (N6-threonylcarbamoyladenosine(37)-N6)-methyltransferase TrmO [Alteromonas sp. LMIT006]UTP71638.1 tRNA (N6-threonylcarbamoyladenosine(37)-N6)-methyltransferase TrmO [Alteromonas sp. LMIT006]